MPNYFLCEDFTWVDDSVQVQSEADVSLAKNPGGTQELPITVEQEETALGEDNQRNALVLITQQSLEGETAAYLDTPDDVKECDHFLSLGAKLLNRLDRESVAKERFLNGTIVNLAIQGGEIALKLKVQVKSAGIKWEQWVRNNIPLIDKRKLERWMQIAQRPDAHQYGHAGFARLLKLISATKTMGGDDPISEVLASYDIDVETPIADLEELADFNYRLDAALGHINLLKIGFNADFDVVLAFTSSGGKVDGELGKKLKEHQDGGGEINEFLKNPEEFGKKKSNGSGQTSSRKKISPAILNIRIGELINSLNLIIPNIALLSKLDKNLIKDLSISIDKIKLSLGIVD